MGENIDRIIQEIKTGQIVNELDVIFVLRKFKELLFMESNLLLLQSPIIICGDIHGQLDDLIKLFRVSGDDNSLTQHYLFLGDYVDRGYFSLNSFLLIACYKIKYNHLVHMLRGNHESRQISFKYGFYAEINANYGHQGLYLTMNDIFDLLPLAAIVDNEVFAVHGGLSPDLNFVSKLQTIKRDVEVPSAGIMADLLWSDPEDGAKAWRPNMRGSGYSFGEKQNRGFLHDNHLKIVMRSHQLAMEGYQYFFSSPEQQAKNGTKGDLLLIWSAPNYMYTSNNMATVCKFNFSGFPKYHLVEFGPEENRIQPPGGARDSLSQYFV